MQPYRWEELIELKEKATKLGFGEVADKEEVIVVFDWICSYYLKPAGQYL
jgi:hypothetical protein